MGFPERFTLTVRRERHRYVVTAEDPPVTATGPSIASALFNWCTELRRLIEQRGTGVEAAVYWQSGVTRRP